MPAYISVAPIAWVKLNSPYPPDDPINPNAPFLIAIDEGPLASFQFDTTTLPNGQFDFGLNLYDAQGTYLGNVQPKGIDMDMVLTIANGSSATQPAPASLQHSG